MAAKKIKTYVDLSKLALKPKGYTLSSTTDDRAYFFESIEDLNERIEDIILRGEDMDQWQVGIVQELFFIELNVKFFVEE